MESPFEEYFPLYFKANVGHENSKVSFVIEASSINFGSNSAMSGKPIFNVPSLPMPSMYKSMRLLVPATVNDVCQTPVICPKS